MSEWNTPDQHFEVVLMRNGVNEDTATQDDYRRVAVVAKDPIGAMTSDEAVAAAGTDFRVVLATPPGVETGMEVMARQRLMNGQTRDW